MAPNQTPRSQRFVVRKISCEQIGVDVGVGIVELRQQEQAPKARRLHMLSTQSGQCLIRRHHGPQGR
jgi:hypothetical protein